MIASADFVMASTANFFLAEGRERALASLASLQEACKSQGKPFFLLDDASPPEDASEDWLFGFGQRISLPPEPEDEDAHVEAQNARLAEFKRALRRGAKSLGQVVCAASPTVAAAYVAAGVDWIWIEWQHSCQDAATLRAQVAAIAQRGGLSVARTAGAHDKTGIQQCLDAGVDIVLVPYVNTVEEAKESIRHCLFAPQGDRVWNGSALSRSKKIGRDVSARDLRLHGCARGDMPAARDGVRHRRARRPGHVDGARDARFDVRIHEGRRAQVVLQPHRGDLHRRGENRRRIHARRRPIELAVARLSRWSDFRTTSWTRSAGAQSIMTGGMAFGGAFCEDRARPHATEEVVAKPHPSSSRPPDMCARP